MTNFQVFNFKFHVSSRRSRLAKTLTPSAFIIVIATALSFLSSCSNNPYRPEESAEDTYFRFYYSKPSKLDPARAYWQHEGLIIDQVYEPPFSYHYLKRPYELITQTAESIPDPEYYDKDGNRLEGDPAPEMIGRVDYTIKIRKGIMYQNHPCFARDENGELVYKDVSPESISEFEQISDFPQQATHELTANDYALQIRRLADPRLSCPVYSVLARYMVGAEELYATYKEMLDVVRQARADEAGAGYNQEHDEKARPVQLDYMAPECGGITVIDDYTYRISLKNKYPQILYWMCMHFFGPMPQEAVDFYHEPAMVEKQFVINRCPIGTGPYYIHTYKPNEVIIFEKNPNYHEDFYPTEGSPGDLEAGLLADAGKPIPFVTRQYWRYEREAMPAWNKFLQGYYDRSAVQNDTFDQAISFQADASAGLSPLMREKGIELITDVETAFYSVAFNMLDDVVGGNSDENCKLRQALSIALDYNEYIEIFRNGRGILAQGPVPPGIFGYREGEAGTNPFIDEWDPIRQRHVRQPLEVAKRLMREAGYPEGIGPDGTPLTLYLDHANAGEADFRSVFHWMKEQLAVIGVRLKDRGTDQSLFREKRLNGNWQMGGSGWLADYPDPENFLFLFYGPNSKVKTGGVNTQNYKNDEFDKLFMQMESMVNSPARQELIDRMVRIVQHDAPAVWMYNPVKFAMSHSWMYNVKLHNMTYNVMKYRRIDPQERATAQEEWNRPRTWAVIAFLLILSAATVPASIKMYRRERGL